MDNDDPPVGHRLALIALIARDTVARQPQRAAPQNDLPAS
jgi:hypothetical protein